MVTEVVRQALTEGTYVANKKFLGLNMKKADLRENILKSQKKSFNARMQMPKNKESAISYEDYGKKYRDAWIALEIERNEIVEKPTKEQIAEKMGCSPNNLTRLNNRFETKHSKMLSYCYGDVSIWRKWKKNDEVYAD